MSRVFLRSVAAIVYLSLVWAVADNRSVAEEGAAAEAAGEFVPPAASDAHQRLLKDVGEWTAVVKYWMSPDAPPHESVATEEVRAIGDYWVVSDFHGDFGMKFDGHSQTGYDPQSKKYVGTWIDSMTPHMMSLRGKVYKNSGKLMMYGSGIDIQTGEKYKTRNVSWTNEDGTRTFEMYMPVEDEAAEDDTPKGEASNEIKEGGPKAKWWKMMEIVYTRK